MAYIETWDETKPAGTRALNLGDDDIREFKRAIRERLAAGGMHFPSTDDSTAGLFDEVKFIEQSSNPTAEANRGHLFTKDVSGITELYWMDSAGNIMQITSAGKILISNLYASGETNKDLIRHNGTNWARFAWASFLSELQTDLNFGGARNSFSNLLVIRLSNTQVRVTADELTVVNTSNQKQSLSSVNVTADITASGANGLDTGAEANSTWYAVWVIYNGTTTASLLSTSFTAPTMPSGYTYKALVGGVYNNSAGNFVDFTSNGAFYTYKAGQSIASGNLGTGSWTSIAMAAFVPSGLSTMAFGTLGTNARAGISNLNTGTADETVEANKIAPSTGSAGTIYWRLEMFTANTLYAYSDNNNARWYCDGFYMNKL